MINLDSILHRVNKPARYTGGEWNSIVKDWDQTPVRIALAYPDVYEIGMSNMALPILYDIFNRQPGRTCREGLRAVGRHGRGYEGSRPAVV